MKRRGYLRQRGVKGGRTPVASGVIRDIEHAIAAEQRKYGVSRSFVIAVALGAFFGIDEQETYRDREREPLRLVSRRRA
jgi:hypothetical protein